SVASVTIDGVALDPTGYRWVGGGNRRHAVIIRRVSGRDDRFTAPEATVTYTHGWAATPGQIVAAIVAMTRDTANRGANGGAVTSETLGPFAEQSEPVSTGPADMSVPGSTRSLLDRLCG